MSSRVYSLRYDSGPTKRKEWEREPVFQDLMLYNKKKDILEPTKFLLEGKSETINNILKTTTAYPTYNHALKDIYLRAWAKERMVTLNAMFPDRMEAPQILKANMIFTELFESMNPLSGDKAEKEFKEAFQKKIQLEIK